MAEIKKAKGGSFKTMSLNPQLLHNIPFEIPTPIQRKTIPLLLEKRSLMGIARTGSGKTLCYLVPAIMNAIDGGNVLILLPTKELVLQVKSVLKLLSRGITFSGTVTITTLKSLEPADISLLVVDEIDRILEEPSLNEFFEEITGKMTCQRVYFSATLPDKPLGISTVHLECKLPESIQHNFFYVPSDSKESALLSVLDREKKTIIFVATRYGVDFLLAVLEKHSIRAKGIYSSMDDDARKYNFNEFMSGRTKTLVVTDVAARGLDIPHLDVSISFDLSDEKTFVHRVGRVRGMGEQFSFVTYSDVFHFFNIRETHLPTIEIGTIPQDILDKYTFSDLSHFKYLAMRGYQRCLTFRRKVSVPSEFKALIDSFTIHSRFSTKEKLSDQIRKLNARKVNLPQASTEVSFKDPFYIPYSKNERKTHSSAFALSRDDYRKEQPEKQRYRPRQRQQVATKPSKK